MITGVMSSRNRDGVTPVSWVKAERNAVTNLSVYEEKPLHNAVVTLNMC